MRTFDLRGQHGFLPDVGVEENLRVGQNGGQAVKATQGKHRILHEFLNLDIQFQWWRRWQRVGHKSPGFLTSRGGKRNVVTGQSAFHGN